MYAAPVCKDGVDIPIPIDMTAASGYVNPNRYGSEEAIAKSFKRVPKMFHIVFSKEYFYRYQEIKNMTGFVDYAEYKQYLKNYYSQPHVTP